MVKILYFAGPPVPKHFHCIVCLLVLCSIPFISPQKMRGLILRRKTSTVSVEAFTFYVHLAFERLPGTEWPDLYFRALFILKEFLYLSIWFFLQQYNKIYRLTSKRLLFWCYSPCSEDSENGSCSNKIKTTCYNCLSIICCTCRHWKDTRDWWTGLFLLYNSSQCLAICRFVMY